MSAKTRVFITDARLSYPSLVEPRAPLNQGGEPKFDATFLVAPNSPAAQQLQQAIQSVADEEFGPNAARILSNGGSPLKRGDDKQNPPAGYAGNLYITARSKMCPDLRDGNPKIMITDPAVIRERFKGGYHVNAYVEIFAYQAKAPSGAVIKSGVGAMLLGVQFRAYDQPFGMTLSAADYPDESAAAAESAKFAPEPTPVAPAPTAAPVAPAQQPHGVPQAAPGNPRGYYGTAQQVNQGSSGYYGAAQQVNQGSSGYYGGQSADNIDNSDVPF